MAAISAREYQLPCINGVIATWNKSLPAVITAQTGAGKTFITARAIELYKADYVFVVCPKSIKYKWRSVLSVILP